MNKLILSLIALSLTISAAQINANADDATKDILTEIGWKFKNYDYSIVCDNISDDGLGSAYTSHSFRLSGGNTAIDKYKWTFALKDKTGRFVTIEEGSDNNFTFEKISSPTDYYINLNGDLEGQINCTFTSGDREIKAKPFNISLELKPTIIRIYDIETTPVEDYYMHLSFKVDYIGADFITVEKEEEFDPGIEITWVNEPFIAHVRLEWLRSIFNNWITVTAKNKYGESTETFELPPILPELGDTSTIDLVEVDETTPSACMIYTTTGKLVYSGTLCDPQKIGLIPGIYIRQASLNNNELVTTKIIVK